MSKTKLTSRVSFMVLLVVPLLTLFQNCGGFHAYSGSSNHSILQVRANIPGLNYLMSYPVGSVTLPAGQSLSVGDLQLVMQTDGNFVLYQAGNPLWASASNTPGPCPNCLAVFQSDGNLVVYNQDIGAQIFNTATEGRGANLNFADSVPYLTVTDASGNIIWASQQPSLDDLFNGRAYFQPAAQAQQTFLNFTEPIPVYGEKMVVFQNPNNGMYYTIARGLQPPDYVRYDLYEFASSDGVNFNQIGAVGPGLFTTTMGTTWSFYDPHIAIDNSVSPANYILTMECAETQDDYPNGPPVVLFSSCISTSTTPWDPTSWSNPQVIVMGEDGVSASVGTTLADNGNIYIKWAVVDSRSEATGSVSTWATQINSLTTVAGSATHIGTRVLGAESNSACTDSWDCDNRDAEDWKREGNYYYMIENGSNYYVCVRPADEFAAGLTSQWSVGIRRSTSPLGDYSESTGEIFVPTLNNQAQFAYPTINTINGSLFMYYAYLVDDNTPITLRSQLLWGKGVSAAAAPMPANPVFSGTQQMQYVTNLYAGLLGRAPDLTGYQNNMAFVAPANNDLCSGIASGFYSSPEFTQRNPQLSNDQFITAVYQGVLGRPVDPSGYASMSAVLAAGGFGIRASLFQNLLNSAEFQNDCVSNYGFSSPSTPNNVMTILSAIYGQGSHTEDCTSYVTTLCNGQSSCHVTPSNTLCGGDPDPGVVKALRISYTCSNGGTYPFTGAYVAEGATQAVYCGN